MIYRCQGWYVTSEVGTQGLQFSTDWFISSDGDPALDPTPGQGSFAVPMFFAVGCYLLMQSVKNSATSCCSRVSCKYRWLDVKESWQFFMRFNRLTQQVACGGCTGSSTQPAQPVLDTVAATQPYHVWSW